MRIDKIDIENFKSFEKETFEFHDIHVLIGANASGKSNFVQVFEFLKNIKDIGIQRAVAHLGGINNLLNFNTQDKPLSIQINFSPKRDFFFLIQEKKGFIIRRRVEEIKYYVQINKVTSPEVEFEFEEELFFTENSFLHKLEGEKIKEEVTHLDKEVKHGLRRYKDGKFFAILGQNHNYFQYIKSNDEEGEIESFFPLPNYTYAFQQEYTDKTASVLGFWDIIQLPVDLFDYNIYDINSKVLKNTTTFRNETELDKDGSNLVLVIDSILKDEERKEQFLADISNLLPFIEDIKTIRFQNYIDILVKEKNKPEYVSGMLFSDGTVVMLSLIIGLYYQKKSVIFIEEIEQWIHPTLIESIIERVYDVAQHFNKQIIITTHNPEVLKHIELKDIYLVGRDEMGLSKIEQPATKEMVQTFLENGLELEDLYLQNLLND